MGSSGINADMEVSPFGSNYNLHNNNNNSSKLNQYLSNWTPHENQISEPSSLTETKKTDHMTEEEIIEYYAAQLMLEVPPQPIPQHQINMGMNKSEFDLSNTTNNENLENSHVQNIIQYNEDKQLSDTNEQIDKNICNSELLNSNFSGGMIVIENPSQPKTHLQNQNDNGINNNEFNSTNTSKSGALETINLQDLLQYSELSQLPTTISHKNNITFDSDYLNQMLQNHTLHQSLQGESNTQLSLQQIQNEKHGESCEMISIVSQGVNTKGHMTVNLENTQNRIYNNVEDIKPVTSG